MEFLPDLPLCHSCLGCIPLRTGAILIAALEILVGVAVFVSFALYYIEEEIAESFNKAAKESTKYLKHLTVNIKAISIKLQLYSSFRSTFIRKHVHWHLFKCHMFREWDLTSSGSPQAKQGLHQCLCFCEIVIVCRYIDGNIFQLFQCPTQGFCILCRFHNRNLFPTLCDLIYARTTWNQTQICKTSKTETRKYWTESTEQVNHCIISITDFPIPTV